MKEKKLILNGKQLFFRTAGEGPTVVLLHGFGEDGTIWNNQFLLAGYKLIIPDLPGSGRSDMIEDMSMDGMAAAVKEIINAEVSSDFNDAKESTGKSGKEVVVIGHSMGGYITLSLAEKYPEMLKGFGLFHSTAFADNEEKKEIRKKAIDFIEQHGAFEFLKTSIPNLYSPVTKEKNPACIEQQIQTSHNFSGAALVSYYMSMMQRPDRTHVLKSTHLPVLLVFGKYDSAVPLEDGYKLAHMPLLSYIHILDNSGHMGMIEEPEKSNTILLNYLNSIHLT